MKKLGRRAGGEAPKVKVVATPEMVELRKAQTRLNHFLWTTEICYGHILAWASSDFADPETPVNLTFGHVRSAAWFPKQSGEREVYRDDRSLPGSDSKKYRRSVSPCIGWVLRIL
jgi:hypothetical protein